MALVFPIIEQGYTSICYRQYNKKRPSSCKSYLSRKYLNHRRHQKNLFSGLQYPIPAGEFAFNILIASDKSYAPIIRAFFLKPNKYSHLFITLSHKQHYPLSSVMPPSVNSSNAKYTFAGDYHG